MILLKERNYDFGEEISDVEYKVINKFLESYRNQNVIIADKYRQDFEMIPLEERSIIFKSNEDSWKRVDFCRRIDYKRTPYIVHLGLWRANCPEEDPKCLSIIDFRIEGNGKTHFI